MSLSRSETSVRAHRLQRIAGLLVVLAPVQYWVFEAISAAAWHSPPYSYTYNWVSDLGVTAARAVFEGRVVSSPLHALMNGSFTALGLLVLGAAMLLFLSQKGLRGRAALLTFGIVFAGGSWLVAGFPENTIGALHLTGAFGNIVGGNVRDPSRNFGSSFRVPPTATTRFRRPRGAGAYRDSPPLRTGQFL
jgi:hypothetical protein